jgi:hypothetical protein
VEVRPNIYSIPDIINKNGDVFGNIQQKYGMSGILILDYGNRLYTQGNYPSTDADIANFAKYAAWIATRYKGKVKYYEIWNEWLLGTGVPNKKNKRPSDDVYLSLVKETSLAIRKADPSAIIMTGSINPLKEQDRKWMLGLVSKGILNYIDAISIHPYSFQFKDIALQSPEGNSLEVDSFEKELKNIHNEDVPIYITEVGYPTNYLFGGFQEGKAGIDTVKYTLLAKSRSYIKGIWWYDLIDDGVSSYNREHHFGLLSNDLNFKSSAALLNEFSGLIKNSEVSVIDQSANGQTHLVINYLGHKGNVTWDNTTSDSDFLNQLRQINRSTTK